MNREFFNKQFAALVNAYTISQKLSDEAQDVYWEMLKDIPEEKFHVGVRKCLAELKFFPTIHELGTASLPLTTKTIRLRERFATVEVDWQEQVSDMQGQAQLKIDAPPTKKEAREILDRLHSTAAFLESQEKVNNRNGKRKDGDLKWTQ
jgi:hypothetical protein